jgi:hypothetical protein
MAHCTSGQAALHLPRGSLFCRRQTIQQVPVRARMQQPRRAADVKGSARETPDMMKVPTFSDRHWKTQVSIVWLIRCPATVSRQVSLIVEVHFLLGAAVPRRRQGRLYLCYGYYSQNIKGAGAGVSFTPEHRPRVTDLVDWGSSRVRA